MAICLFDGNVGPIWTSPVALGTQAGDEERLSFRGLRLTTGKNRGRLSSQHHSADGVRMVMAALPRYIQRRCQ